MHAFALTWWLAVHFVLLLLPGAAVASIVVQHRSASSPSFRFPLVLVASGAVWTASFFAFWAAPALGRALTFAGCAAALLLLARGRGRAFARLLFGDHDVRTPLLLAFALAVGFTGVLTLYGGYDHPASIANERFIPGKPPDNILPGIFADRVTDGDPTDPFWGDWLSSDRPPLQAGAVSFVRPFSTRSMSEIRYQTAGTALQLLVVPALWGLLRTLRVPRRLVIPAVLTASVSGTVLFNSVYLWPKLLSATFCLVALQVLASRGPRSLAGAALGLAFLAHGGALFVAAPLAAAAMGWSVWRIAARGLPLTSLLRSATALALGAIVLYAPWTAYQRWVAPPGNRLLKWHLAGAAAIDDRSVTEAVIDAYTTPSLGDIADLKRENISFLVSSDRFVGDLVPVRGGEHSMQGMRDREFVHLANAIGPAWFGLPLAGIGVAATRRRARARLPAPLPPAFDAAAVLLAACALATAVWCVVMYGPSTTFVHQGSLAVPVVTMAALALLAASVRPWLGWVVVAAMLWRTARVWIAGGSTKAGPELSNSGMLMLLAGVLAGAAVTVAALLVERRRMPAATTSPGRSTHPPGGAAPN